MRVKSLQDLPLPIRQQLETRVASTGSIAAPAPHGEAKSSKYGSIRTEVNGITFDSKWEGQRYMELLIMERTSLIKDLQVHSPFALHSPSRCGEKIRVGSIVIDFVYWGDDGQMRCEDTKSAPTRRHPLYRLKKAMFEVEYGITIKEVVRCGH